MKKFLSLVLVLAVGSFAYAGFSAKKEFLTGVVVVRGVVAQDWNNTTGPAKDRVAYTVEVTNCSGYTDPKLEIRQVHVSSMGIGEQFIETTHESVIATYDLDTVDTEQQFVKMSIDLEVNNGVNHGTSGTILHKLKAVIVDSTDQVSADVDLYYIEAPLPEENDGLLDVELDSSHYHKYTGESPNLSPPGKLDIDIDLDAHYSTPPEVEWTHVLVYAKLLFVPNTEDIWDWQLIAVGGSDSTFQGGIGYTNFDDITIPGTPTTFIDVKMVWIDGTTPIAELEFTTSAGHTH